MNKQINDLSELYKNFIDIFNNWEFTKNDDVDFYYIAVLKRIYLDLTDILEKAGKIEKVGIKSYKIIEGENNENK